jgi:hypothetical protein
MRARELTGMTAGERGADGQSPAGTLHARVEELPERWDHMAEAERTARDEN